MKQKLIKNMEITACFCIDTKHPCGNKEEGMEVGSLLCIPLISSYKKAPWYDKMIFILFFIIKLTPLNKRMCRNLKT